MTPPEPAAVVVTIWGTTATYRVKRWEPLSSGADPHHVVWLTPLPAPCPWPAPTGRVLVLGALQKRLRHSRPDGHPSYYRNPGPPRSEGTE